MHVQKGAWQWPNQNFNAVVVVAKLAKRFPTRYPVFGNGLEQTSTSMEKTKMNKKRSVMNDQSKKLIFLIRNIIVGKTFYNTGKKSVSVLAEMLTKV